MKKMTSNNVKGAVNVGHLLEKLETEYSFISSVLDRVPLIYSQDTEDASDEDESQKHANAVMSKSGNATRANTVEELQERLDALKSKSKPGMKNSIKKKDLETKLRNKKKKDDRNSGPHRLKRLEKLERRKHEMRMKSAESKHEMRMKPSEKRPPEQKPSKPVYNSEGKMVFSKFDFSDVGSVNDLKKKKKETKDPKKILEKLKEKKETLKKLKDEGKDDKVLKMVKKEAWSNALKKAEGIKIRDDPELLKKSIRRKEAQKRSSAKKWASRESTIKKKKKEKDEKRESNLQNRKDSKKQKKRAAAIKRGRIVPGF
ncbi:surfeit locus protein 6 homolog [Thrips palmi]|uniref:Surfeit locus protein 6 homolog n=1 Tax=Thrips palmi TaxID=161013 RepID=A0A6P8YCY8_THRPL|nr:surfeit locus protein 6 homolog [Thrips palmi]